ncbi:hypothetical protein SEA_SATIS_304 [Streptomyces phage Satis]|nr:hypothetical protein SEA_SATIS_304 [Streptomyces phage Satis]QBZ72190.1 hypothetical protein SEA_KRADAL_304 [Streptomyces phage Kradal]QPL14612.1 hypothetical protein SEA_EHYELIMAYOE_307 [Streptomyces phage EhyElimayoE]
MGGWVQHGEIWTDDGDVGGDVQLGKAASVRFVNPAHPGARVTVYAYAHAPERAIEGRIGSIEVHSGYAPDLDNLGVESQTWFEIDDDAKGDADEWDPTWSEIQHQSLDTFISPGGDDERTKMAEAMALAWIRSFSPDRDIDWDGKRF